MDTYLQDSNPLRLKFWKVLRVFGIIYIIRWISLYFGSDLYMIDITRGIATSLIWSAIIALGWHLVSRMQRKAKLNAFSKRMDDQFPELKGLDHKKAMVDTISEMKNDREDFVAKLNEARAREGLSPIDKEYGRKWTNLEISAFDEEPD